MELSSNTFPLDLGTVLTDIERIDGQLKESVKQTNQSNPFCSHFHTMISDLRQSLYILRTDTQNFVATFEGYRSPKTSRVRRANLIGQFTAPIFGFVTDSNLMKVIHQVDANFQRTAQTLNKQVSTIQASSRHLNKVVKAVKKAQWAVEAITKHVHKIDKVLAELDTSFITAESLQFLTSSVNAADTAVRRIMLELNEVRMQGKISSALLPPSALKELLQSIQIFQVDLLYPPMDTYLQDYFHMCQTVVKLDGLRFFIVVKIPLRTDDTYHLYRLHPFNIPYNTSEWARRVSGLPSYLAVREDRKISVVFNNLDPCTFTRDRYICSLKSHYLSTTQNTCPLALYRGEANVDDVCDFTYSYNEVTDFTRIQDEWVGTTNQPQKVEEVCTNSSPSFTIPSGVCSIPIRANCKIICDDFLLPPFGVQGTSNFSLTLLATPYMLDPLYHLKLQPLADIKLASLHSFKHSDLRFLKLQHIVAPFKEVTPLTSSHLTLTIILTLAFIGLASYLTYNRCRNRIYIRESVRYRPKPEGRFSPMSIFNRLSNPSPTSSPSIHNPTPTPPPVARASKPPPHQAPPLPQSRSPRRNGNTLQVPKLTVTDTEVEYLEMVKYRTQKLPIFFYGLLSKLRLIKILLFLPLQLSILLRCMSDNTHLQG